MLLVREIYPAIMGESRHCGWPCVLVRLSGCHRRCLYCDTPQAFQGGAQLTVAAVMDRVLAEQHGMLLVTGGEPLLQPDVIELMRASLAAGLRVVLETSGTLGAPVPLAAVPEGVCRVVDVKTPGSGVAADQIDWQGLQVLTSGDELKLVITAARDWAWTRELVTAGVIVDGRRCRLPADVPVTVSPAWGQASLRDLADWVLRDRLPVRLQVQLHRVIGPEVEHGV